VAGWAVNVTLLFNANLAMQAVAPDPHEIRDGAEVTVPEPLVATVSDILLLVLRVDVPARTLPPPEASVVATLLAPFASLPAALVPVASPPPPQLATRNNDNTIGKTLLNRGMRGNARIEAEAARPSCFMVEVMQASFKCVPRAFRVSPFRNSHVAASLMRYVQAMEHRRRSVTEWLISRHGMAKSFSYQ
jgi:hypothetical protein